jgi:hypothetical protein
VRAGGRGGRGVVMGGEEEACALYGASVFSFVRDGDGGLARCRL